MASEWTTEDVRHIVMDSETFRLQDALAAKFDAWLAMHDAEVRARALRDAADAIGDECASSDYMGDHISDDGIEWWARKLRERADREAEGGAR